MARKSPARCARLWEVEAAEDGRLRGHDVESLRRHVQSCSACEHERTRLTDFRGQLRLLPSPRINAIAARRIRQEVLTAHNGFLMRRGERAKKRRGLGVILLAAACVSLAVFAVSHFAKHGREVGITTDLGPTVDVTASAGARWRRDGTRHNVRIVVDEGQLHLTIQRQHATDRVSIGTPDGEIEDIGTVLDVAVLGGRTQSVGVRQGSVVLRLHGAASRIIAAGETWRREADQPQQTAAPTPPAPKVEEQHSSVRTKPRAERTNAVNSPAPAARESSPSPAEVQTERAEDDAYLHIIDLVRNGDAERARVAAREYLLRFPNGFRRIEVLNIATRGGR